jgi:hypothetical protein
MLAGTLNIHSKKDECCRKYFKLSTFHNVCQDHRCVIVVVFSFSVPAILFITDLSVYNISLLFSSIWCCERNIVCYPVFCNGVNTLRLKYSKR